MALARLLGFDLCPRLKELKQRDLFMPRGAKVPAEIATVCEANVDTTVIEKPLGQPGAPECFGHERSCQCGGGSGAVWLGRTG